MRPTSEGKSRVKHPDQSQVHIAHLFADFSTLPEEQKHLI